MSYPRVNEIVNGKRGITPDIALRLGALLGTSPEFWLNDDCTLFDRIWSVKWFPLLKIRAVTGPTSR